MDKMLTPNEAADRLGVNRSTIMYYIDHGNLAATKVLGRWKIAERDLRDFAKRNNVVLRASGSPAGAR